MQDIDEWDQFARQEHRAATELATDHQPVKNRQPARHTATVEAPELLENEQHNKHGEAQE